MDILGKITLTRKGLCSSLAGALAIGLLFGVHSAFADPPTAMAPPISVSNSGSVDSVFSWREIPESQDVIIKRAVFDQGGYQLYDTAGETIVVPFTNDNLYVMKFAQTSGGRMYFVNEGDYPVLYIPKNGYLENASVESARWYPFGKEFHPDHPVFLGIAPSWSVYIRMGWYPHMHCVGGYWSERPFIVGRIFEPAFDLIIIIGDNRYHDWDDYHRYEREHHPPYHIGYYHRDFYEWARRPHEDFRRYDYDNHPYYAHQAFRGVGGSREAGRGDYIYGRHDGDRDNGRVFHGNDGNGQGNIDRGMNSSDRGDRVFHGAQDSGNRDRFYDRKHDTTERGDHVFRGSQDPGADRFSRDNRDFGAGSGSNHNVDFGASPGRNHNVESGDRSVNRNGDLGDRTNVTDRGYNGRSNRTFHEVSVSDRGNSDRGDRGSDGDHTNRDDARNSGNSDSGGGSRMYRR